MRGFLSAPILNSVLPTVRIVHPRPHPPRASRRVPPFPVLASEGLIRAGALGQEFLNAVLLAAAQAFAAGAAGAERLRRRHEMVLAAADEVGAAKALQRLAQDRPILGVVIAQERLVQAALLQAAGGEDDLAAGAADRPQGIALAVIHRG